MRRGLTIAVAFAVGCNAHPGFPDEQVGYRDGTEDASSGERGTIKITEVLWSGTVTDEGVWDPTDVFVEFRNEGAQPVNMSGWFLELEGPIERVFRFPKSDFVLEVNDEAVAARTTSGCITEVEWLMPDLEFPQGFDPFELTLRDADERLMEPAGNEDMPPFAGGHDGVVSRSMERIHLMFGGRGSTPHAWHHYQESECSDAYYAEDPTVREGHYCIEDLPNNDLLAPNCREYTLASPGRPNSPDYSGAFSSGSFE
jgi:hypothetical protein